MDSGAHFFKTDLQVHSPRDPAVPREAVTDSERVQYAREFVAACRERGVGAVAITDHHDFVFVPFIRAAAADETDDTGQPLPTRRQLVVFPGLELTLEVPCQALLILSADFPDDRLPAVLERLSVDPPSAAVSRAPQPTALRFETFDELYRRLDEMTWLRGQYIVLPNVTDGGHKTLMRSGMQAKYRDMPCVGGYLDKPERSSGLGNRRIFAGNDAAWGRKRLALFQTSDARAFEQLGANPTWVKWAEPSAEALRQACLAQESRIAHAEPPVPNVVLTKLRVSNSRFLGPIELELNPQYSALIGGRGSGKSTCLEYLRWALCDQPPPADTEDEGPDLAVRRRRLIDHTLVPVDGHVEVHFDLHGVPHVVRRYAATGEARVKVGSGALTHVSEADVRALLPIQAYSQRQLSSVGVHIDELRRFVTAPVAEELDELATRQQSLASDIRENRAQLQRYRSLRLIAERERRTVDSLDQQAEALRAGLGGLAEGDREVLSAKRRYDEAHALVEGWTASLTQAEAELHRSTDAATRLLGSLKTPAADGPAHEVLGPLHSKVQEALVRFRDALQEARSVLGSNSGAGSDQAQLREEWNTRLALYLDKYKAATERSSSHAARLRELNELDERKVQLKQSLDAQEQQVKMIGNPTTRSTELREAWESLQRERTGLLASQCERMTQLSDGLIRASVRAGAGTSTQQWHFRKAIQGSNVRTNKIDDFLEKVALIDDPLGAWLSALDLLESRLRAAAEGIPPSPVPPISPLTAFSDADLDRICTRLSTDAIVELSLLPLDDEPVFEYQSKEGEFIAFGDASAGQQATALLRALLREDGPPLIIDQPEDDLDSQVILDIVSLIWNAKGQRQLIFSSHNANLVVNGDAELVVCFDYRSAGDHSAGQIALQGAIDIPAVRDRITAIMEGGERAFRLRKDKYGF